MSVPPLSIPPLSRQGLTAGIFDVDGVLLASPHERAWREALRGFADPDRFTTAMYQAEVAGKPQYRSVRRFSRSSDRTPYGACPLPSDT